MLKLFHATTKYFLIKIHILYKLIINIRGDDSVWVDTSRRRELLLNSCSPHQCMIALHSTSLHNVSSYFAITQV